IASLVLAATDTVTTPRFAGAAGRPCLEHDARTSETATASSVTTRIASSFRAVTVVVERQFVEIDNTNCSQHPDPADGTLLARDHEPVRAFFFAQRFSVAAIGDDDLLVGRHRVDLK